MVTPGPASIVVVEFPTKRVAILQDETFGEIVLTTIDALRKALPKQAQPESIAIIAGL